LVAQCARFEMNALAPSPFLDYLPILPRRLWLETPDVEATVPMLRGTWGAALYDLDRDAYHAVFGAEGSSDTPWRKSGPPTGDRPGRVTECRGNMPPGYLLRPAPPDPRCAPAVDFFLIGNAIEHDNACRHAWLEAAQRGLGPRRQAFTIRGSFVLGPSGRLSEENQESYGTRSVPATLAWPLSQAVWPLDAGTPCRLLFAAPLRIRRQGRLVEEPTLADIVVAACRRVEAFLPETLWAGWKRYSAAALETARAVPHSAWRGARLDLHRWSARQQNELDLHGVAGSLDLPEGPGELAPLLAAARWLHVGKGTVMGLGQFEVEEG
jgi:hypothetical protein